MGNATHPADGCEFTSGGQSKIQSDIAPRSQITVSRSEKWTSHTSSSQSQMKRAEGPETRWWLRKQTSMVLVVPNRGV